MNTRNCVFKMMNFAVDDPKPLIRSISCWAVSRYTPWVANQLPESGVLGAVLGKFGERCLDNNKRVQEAAISVAIFIQIDDFLLLEMMDFAFKVMHFVFKMMDFNTNVQALAELEEG